MSPWAFWSAKACGSPQGAPKFPTANRITRTSDDAQFRFAAPKLASRCDDVFPVKTSFFQINLGSGWFHPTANGNPSAPSGDSSGAQHPYTFTVVGQGKKPEFRFVDWHPSDNDGKFKIEIEAAP